MDGSESVALWCQCLRRRYFSRTTVRGYRETITTFQWWLADQNLRFGDATTPLIERWLDSRGLAASTRRQYVSRLRMFYGFLLDHGHVTVDPTRQVVQPKVGRYLPRPAPTGAIYQNISANNPRVAAMVALGAYMGLRRFEIAKLRAEDIDLTVTPPVVTVRGKGNVDRRIPVNATVAAALARHGLPTCGWVFPSPKGGALSPQRCGRLIADALSTSDGRVTAHQLRHWFGTRLYQGSGDIRMVQDLLGHASLAATQVYVQWAPERAGPAVEALPSRPAPPEAA